VIEIAVGHEELVGRRIHDHVCRASELRRVLAVGHRPRLADLQDELAGACELEHHPVGHAVAGDPDEVVVVDIDAVLVRRPVVAFPGPAPRLDDVAVLIEFDDRRRRLAALDVWRRRGALLARVECARPLIDPDVILRVDEDAADLPEDPLVG
jgi:hypothetical protein